MIKTQTRDKKKELQKAILAIPTPSSGENPFWSLSALTYSLNVQIGGDFSNEFVCRELATFDEAGAIRVLCFAKGTVFGNYAESILQDGVTFSILTAKSSPSATS